jgi:hypothetical protein
MQTAEKTLTHRKQKFNSFYQRTKTPEQRFWDYVDKNGSVPDHMARLGKCWIWRGVKDRYGYGNIAVIGKTVLSHRFSFSLHYKVPIKGFCVLHKCDNPPCVNPKHLFRGNNKDNSYDMTKKGRQAKGENVHLAKLNAEKVKAIRTLIQDGHSECSIARIFHVTQHTVYCIKYRITWKHIV